MNLETKIIERWGSLPLLTALLPATRVVTGRHAADPDKPYCSLALSALRQTGRGNRKHEYVASVLFRVRAADYTTARDILDLVVDEYGFGDWSEVQLDDCALSDFLFISSTLEQHDQPTDRDWLLTMAFDAHLTRDRLAASSSGA